MAHTYAYIWGSGDAAEDGVWEPNYERQVVSASTLSRYGYGFMWMVLESPSDEKVDAIVAKIERQRAERMGK